MHNFAQLLVEADLTGSEKTRQALLENYFSKASNSEACWATYLLSDKQRTRFIKSEELRKHFLAYSDIPAWLFDASNKHVDDIAECISLIAKIESPITDSSDSSTSIPNLLEEQLPEFKQQTTLEAKQSQLNTWWQNLSGDEIYLLNKLLTGSFRGGSLKPFVIPALAKVLNKSEAELTYKLSGKYAPSSEFFQNLKESSTNPSEPYVLQDAAPWNKNNDLNFKELHFEWKYDGIRGQLIKRDDEVFLWSKQQELLNEQFPDLVASAIELENGTVLDGEIVGLRDGDITMMNGLRGRLERKKPTKLMLKDLPVQFVVFDVLEHKSISTQSNPFKERHLTLNNLELPIGISQAKQIKLSSIEELKPLVISARENNFDGIVIRHKYSIDNTENYWSHQTPALTLLAVLTYVQGKIYSFSLNQNGELITFCKVENHLQSKQELTSWVKANSLERFGPVTSVKAEQVFEIAFDSIFESKRHKSGLSLKNPRLVAWRKDLSLNDIDSLETAKNLLQ